MKRAQILLDEPTYKALRRRAFEAGTSLSALAREILRRALRTAPSRKKLRLKDFAFIGAGASQQGKLSPVSERHDEALAEELARKRGR